MSSLTSFRATVQVKNILKYKNAKGGILLVWGLETVVTSLHHTALMKGEPALGFQLSGWSMIDSFWFSNARFSSVASQLQAALINFTVTFHILHCFFVFFSLPTGSIRETDRVHYQGSPILKSLRRWIRQSRCEHVVWRPPGHVSYHKISCSGHGKGDHCCHCCHCWCCVWFCGSCWS